jgi:tetratricopeptide (TPR) repeat protein
MGQFEEAAKLLEVVASEHAALANPRPMDVVATYCDLGLSYRHIGKFDEAEKAFQKGWAALPKDQGDSDGAITLGNNHATLMQVVSNLPESERLYRQVLASLDRRGMGAQGDGVVIASNLALTCLHEGKYQDAVDVLVPKVAACEKIYPPDHISRLIFMSNLATSYQRLKDFDKAESIMRAAIEAREKKTGPDDPELLTTRSNLYTVLMDAKKFDEAVVVIGDVTERARRVLGEKNQTTLVAMNNLANVLDRLDKLDEAEKVMRRVVELSRPENGAFPHGAWEPAVFQNVLANVLIRERKFEEAERVLDGAIELLRSRLNETNPNVIYAYSCKVSLYKAWERPDELALAQAKYEVAKAARDAQLK